MMQVTASPRAAKRSIPQNVRIKMPTATDVKVRVHPASP